jgi:hypothetical protein
MNTYGLAQEIIPYGGAISRASFVYFIPELIVNRGATEAIINVANPPNNGTIRIFRANDYIGTFTELPASPIPLTSLPFTDSTINNTLSHKYKAKFVYLFNGQQINDAPKSNPVYTIQPNGEL